MTTAKTQSVTIMAVIETTTAEVAAVPTAEALEPLCIPRRQPAAATITPKITLLVSPRIQDPQVRALVVWVS